VCVVEEVGLGELVRPRVNMTALIPNGSDIATVYVTFEIAVLELGLAVWVVTPFMPVATRMLEIKGPNSELTDTGLGLEDAVTGT
jgi:hypothetical protein